MNFWGYLWDIRCRFICWGGFSRGNIEVGVGSSGERLVLLLQGGGKWKKKDQSCFYPRNSGFSAPALLWNERKPQEPAQSSKTWIWIKSAQNPCHVLPDKGQEPCGCFYPAVQTQNLQRDRGVVTLKTNIWVNGSSRLFPISLVNDPQHCPGIPHTPHGACSTSSVPWVVFITLFFSPQ